MREQKPLGPERVTPLERFIGLLHLPYGIGCLVFISLFSSFAFFAAYLDSYNLEEAFRLTFATTYSIQPTTVTPLEGVRTQILWNTLLFMLLYMTRSIRLKLLSSEKELTSLTPQGEKTLHKTFGGVSHLLPVVLLSTLFFAAELPYLLAQEAGPTLRFFGIIGSLASNFIIGSFLWVYSRSLWGLHLLGREPLKLKSYYEDPMLGLKRVGTIALWLAFTFFVITGLSTLALLFSPDLLSIIQLSIGSLFGVIMFFLPLNSIHRQMQREKRLHQASVRSQFAQILNGANPDPPAGAEGMLARVSELLTLQIAKDDATRMPTWPFDTSIMSRFAAIILTVTAIILARIIMVAIGI